ncbi:tetratricopeptide repeat protein [Elizabethkingia sp. YR214]|uniref:tetratricopeptide repeat-containing sensor histidine kinase n=1 Tax=Elizabethkingia sp. YR214 TaxID=2135667 RepID=UPI000D405F02|nr:tetratricopeptide repeat-containing sensor histidine kinase [Elizabethkingia sp. YR214]PUB29565.1 tetratricopeptide repeat protein [Elizabethkingia sp. YR214]
MKNSTILFLFLIILSCTNTKENVKVNRGYYDKAYEFLETSQKDSAFVYFNKAKEIFIQNKRDYSLAGNCLVNMGIIQYESGDFYGAQETALSAIKYLNEKDKEDFFDISSNYNNLGIINRNLENYNKAIEFYNLAMKFSLEDTNKQVYLNNIAYAYGEQKKYKEALKIYNQIFKKDNKNNKEYSRALTNQAKMRWLQNPNYNPIPELKEAMDMRLKEKDLWGQNSSYAHLADYYTQKKTDSALIYATKMYSVAKTLKSPDDQIEALQKLIVLENPEKSKQYFLTYQKLNDSLQTARSKAKNQFALIRYETEKNKANFQKAQADNVKKQNQILKQYAGLGALGLILIGTGFWYKRRRKRLEKEKELEVKNTELRYSKKVHDKVANKVYRVMSEVENTPEIEKEVLLDRLENIYEISRDISYDHEPTDEKHLVEMLESYSSQDDVQLVKVGIPEIGWDTFNKDIQSEVFNVLQELMTNMKKHSKATRVVIKMSRINQEITIRYMDNGVGSETFSPKNGIKNTGNRMEAIGGTITFDAISSEGFKAELKFSVQ